MAWTEQDSRNFDRAMSDSRAEYLERQAEEERDKEHYDRLTNGDADDFDIQPLSSFAEKEVKRREEEVEAEVEEPRTTTTSGPIFPPNVTCGLAFAGLIVMSVAPALSGLCLLGAAASIVINMKD